MRSARDFRRARFLISESYIIDKSPTALARLTTDALALCAAAMDGDLDEARFRAQLVASSLRREDNFLPFLAAAKVIACLGAPGSEPGPGLGLALIQLADLLSSQLVVEA